MKREVFIVLFVTVILFILSGANNCTVGTPINSISIGNPNACCQLQTSAGLQNCMNDVSSDQCTQLKNGIDTYNGYYLGGQLLYTTGLTGSCSNPSTGCTNPQLSCTYQDKIYENGEKVCLESSNVIYQCVDGKWTTSLDCSSSGSCANTISCQNPALTPVSGGLLCSTGICGGTACQKDCQYASECANSGIDNGNCHLNQLCDRDTTAMSCNSNSGFCESQTCKTCSPGNVLMMNFEPNLYSADFSGTVIDANKFLSSSSPSGIFTITQNDKITLEKTSTTCGQNQCYGKLSSLYELQGDFAVQLDYDLITFSAGNTTGGNQFVLKIIDTSSNNNWGIFAQKGWSNQGFTLYKSNTGTTWATKLGIDPQLTGKKLRIIKKAGTLSFYYLDSVNKWIKVGSDTPIPSITGSSFRVEVILQNNRFVSALKADVDNLMITNVPDLSGNNNYGIINGSVSYANSAFTNFGYALNTGSGANGNSTVIIDDSVSLQPLNAVSVSAWIKIPTTTSDYSSIVEHLRSPTSSPTKYTTDRPKGYSLLVDQNNNLRFDIGYGSGTQGVGFDYQGVHGTTNLETNQWYYVVGTFDKSVGEMKVYINGILEGTNNYSQLAYYSITAGSHVYIGKDSSNELRYFNGMIDNVLIYNRALSQQEITDYYNKHSPTCIPAKPLQCADGIDNDGNGLTDLSDPGCSSASDDSEFSATSPILTSLSVGGFFSGTHSCVINQNKQLYCWGDNMDGQLGLGDTTYRNVPTLVSGITNSIITSAGLLGKSNCAITDDGTGKKLYCWGDNSYGVLGLGDNLNRNVPTLVSGMINPISVSIANGAGSSGVGNTLSIDNGGNLYSWGGEPGTGESSLVPELEISGLSQVIQISTGYQYDCAITDNGTIKKLYCWGANNYGQLGLGDFNVRGTPTFVSGITNPIFVTSNWKYTCAINQNKQLYCWGDNSGGQLGLGDSVSRNVPTIISSLTNVVAVDTSYSRACAITENGTIKRLYCWGSGILGFGNTVPVNIPTLVSNLTNVNAVGASENHICAITNDGTSRKLYCWGSQYYVGLGSIVGDKLVPTYVMDL